MPIFARSTRLEAPADRVWQRLLRIDTFFHVVRGLIGFTLPKGADLPETYREGQIYRGRLWLAHVIPLWTHTLEIERIDEPGHTIQTHEGGGPMRVWNHHLKVEPESATTCRYTDTIEFEAGWLNPLARLVVGLIFAYRQARWRRLARRI